MLASLLQRCEGSADAAKGHVNNVMYNRYAESARVNWTLKFAAQDPVHKTAWLELMSPKSIGLILRSIKTDYKFVSSTSCRDCRVSRELEWLADARLSSR